MSGITARGSYGAAVSAVRDALRRGFGRFRRGSPELHSAARGLCATVADDPQGLLALAVHETAECHVYAHAVNTAVYAAVIGKNLVLAVEALEELVFQALVLDARLGARSDFPWVQGSPERPVEDILHPQGAAGLFAFAASIEDGLPSGLARIIEDGAEAVPERRQANQGALLLALCDFFEGATHGRPWRRAEGSSAALFALLRGLRRSSDAAVVKAFCEGVTVYPPGTFVRLTNGEYAAVVSTRADNPSRPVVRVICSSRGTPIVPAIRLDVAAGSNVHVEGSVPSHKVPLADPWDRAAMALERFWWDGRPGAY
ncbi:MAG: hypothetical protein HY928_13970 [Elusimicrobia bacterium]|nr:hypothetical protein [Elusimicrobiota bacterium]